MKDQEVNCISDNQTQYKIITVHQFTVGDVDDPDLYAAMPISDWQKTPSGVWVMEKAAEPPTYHQSMDPNYFGWKYIIRAKLDVKDITYFYLKWGNDSY